MQNPGVALHVMISLAGLAMLLGSGVFGLGSLVLHRRLAARKFDELLQHLPSLEEMYRLRRVTLYGGWLLITVSLVAAFVWAWTMKPDERMMSSHMHPMLTLWVTVSALCAGGAVPLAETAAAGDAGGNPVGGGAGAHGGFAHRHLCGSAPMKLEMIGLNHTTAVLETRGKAAISAEQLPAVTTRLLRSSTWKGWLC